MNKKARTQTQGGLVPQLMQYILEALELWRDAQIRTLSDMALQMRLPAHRYQHPLAMEGLMEITNQTQCLSEMPSV